MWVNKIPYQYSAQKSAFANKEQLFVLFLALLLARALFGAPYCTILKGLIGNYVIFFVALFVRAQIRPKGNTAGRFLTNEHLVSIIVTAAIAWIHTHRNQSPSVNHKYWPLFPRLMIAVNYVTNLVTKKKKTIGECQKTLIKITT